MITAKHLVAALALSAALIAPAAAQGNGHDDHHAASAGAITIVHPWARAAHQGETSLVFFEIENAGETDRLLGAETEIADTVEIVGIVLSGTDVTYQVIEGIDIAAGDFDFDPKGLGLLLSGLKQDLVQGEEFDLELHFEKAGHVHLHVEIEAENASQHSHAGHAH